MRRRHLCIQWRRRNRVGDTKGRRAECQPVRLISIVSSPPFAELPVFNVLTQNMVST